MGPELQNSFKEGSRDQLCGKLTVRHHVFRNYRVIHNIRPKVKAYCSLNKSLRDFQSLLGAHQMWSIC